MNALICWLGLNLYEYVNIRICIFPCQVAKTKQRIEEEKMQVQVVERTQQIMLQEQEITRREKELEAKVKKPADAERYRLEKLAEAQRWVTRLFCLMGRCSFKTTGCCCGLAGALSVLVSKNLNPCCSKAELTLEGLKKMFQLLSLL